MGKIISDNTYHVALPYKEPEPNVVSPSPLDFCLYIPRRQSNYLAEHINNLRGSTSYF